MIIKFWTWSSNQIDFVANSNLMIKFRFLMINTKIWSSTWFFCQIKFDDHIFVLIFKYQNLIIKFELTKKSIWFDDQVQNLMIKFDLMSRILIWFWFLNPGYMVACGTAPFVVNFKSVYLPLTCNVNCLEIIILTCMSLDRSTNLTLFKTTDQSGVV